MAAIYQEIELEWGGRTYNLTPTYRVIQQVEQRISLASLVHRMSRGEPPFSQLADLLSAVLRAAGCRDESADPEAIHAMLYDPDHADRLVEACNAVVVALMPKPKRDQGNAEPRSTGANPKSSSGASTTRSPLDTAGSSQASSGG